MVGVVCVGQDVFSQKEMVREHLENLKLKEINIAKDVRQPLAPPASRLRPSKAAGRPAATHTCLASPRLGQAFLACMSHEMRTPLNGLLGMLQARSAYHGCANHGHTTLTMTCAACYRWRHTILAVLQMALAEAEKAVELDSGGEAASTRVMAIRRCVDA